MTDTPNLSLPLLQPAQAQKHVTVNEALVRLDALAQLCLASVTTVAPPGLPAEGAAYGVPAGAADAWAGRDGQVAVHSAGGWVFLPARRGWRAMVLDAGAPAIFDGTGWRLGAGTLGGSGAGLSFRSVEMEVPLTGGASVTTPVAFPERSIALGVTGRVIAGISGTATAWDLGLEGEPARFGSGLGLSLNSWVSGPAAPQVFWAATPLTITAVDGDFAGGAVLLAAHYAELALPDPV